MIETIVFDIGNVLVFTELERAGKFLLEHWGIPTEQFVPIFWQAPPGEQPLAHFVELGQMNPEEFLQAFESKAKIKVREDNFWRMWNCIFAPNDPMIALVERLYISPDHPRLLICSNINAMHHRYLRQNFPVMQRFDGEVCSYRIGAMKPDTRMFSEVEHLTPDSRSSIIFIDDREENVRAAQTFGWQTFHYQRGKEQELERVLTKELKF